MLDCCSFFLKTVYEFPYLVLAMCRKEKTGVDRFSLRQAVIFICATNRPDELDLEFVRSGRIDRRLYIGLPDANQRVQIFKVHSTGKQLAEDVDFEKVSGRGVLLFFIPLWSMLLYNRCNYFLPKSVVKML